MLVATDIAARGIDVSGISHVINFDIPQTTDAYTHRIGRTGRAAKTGDAYTLVSHEDEDTVRQIERMMKTKIERRTLDGFNYKADAPPRSAPGTERHSRGGGGGGGGSRHPRQQQQRSHRPAQAHSSPSHAPAKAPAGDAAPAAAPRKPSFWRSFGKKMR